LREPDLQAADDVFRSVAQCGQRDDRLRLDDVHVLTVYTQRAKPAADLSFGAAVEYADHQPSARLVGVSEDDAIRLEQGQQPLVPRFEIRATLRFERWRFSNERHGDRREHETERASPQILSGRHCTLPPESLTRTGTDRWAQRTNMLSARAQTAFTGDGWVA
jgi:hypothetical protein